MQTSGVNPVVQFAQLGIPAVLQLLQLSQLHVDPTRLYPNTQVSQVAPSEQVRHTAMHGRQLVLVAL